MDTGGFWPTVRILIMFWGILAVFVLGKRYLWFKAYQNPPPRPGLQLNKYSNDHLDLVPSISIQYWYPTTRILIIAHYRFFKSIDLRPTSFILITLKSHVQFTTQPISKPLLGDSYPRLHTRQRRVHHVWNFYKTNDLATHLKRFYLFSFYWVALSIRFLFSLSYVNPNPPVSQKKWYGAAGEILIFLCSKSLQKSVFGASKQKKRLRCFLP